MNIYLANREVIITVNFMFFIIENLYLFLFQDSQKNMILMIYLYYLFIFIYFNYFKYFPCIPKDNACGMICFVFLFLKSE